MDNEQPSKISIAKLVRQSYAIMFRHGRTYIKLILIPFLLLLVIGIGLLMMEATSTTRAWVSILYKLGTFILLVPVVTSWHRLILLDPKARIKYQFGHEEVLYIKVLIGIGIAIYLFSIILGLLFAAPVIASAALVISESKAVSLYKILSLFVMFLVLCGFCWCFQPQLWVKKWRLRNRVSLSTATPYDFPPPIFWHCLFH